MSSASDASAAADRAARQERRTSLSKDLFKRMKTVLKRNKSSTSAAVSEADATPAATAATVQESTALTVDDRYALIFVNPFFFLRQLLMIWGLFSPSAAPVAPPVAPAAVVAAEPSAAAAAATTEKPTPRSMGFARHPSQHQRARALFQRYGLEFDEAEWLASPPSTEAQRVEKRVRMRVHRSCHLCETAYGAEKICRKCEHVRCKQCPRYPAVRTDKERKATSSKQKNVDGKKPITYGDGAAAGTTTASPKKRSNVPKPKVQRIHRWCHKCDVEFKPPSGTLCENCGHVRCTKCPRVPAKKRKFPNGYPGDAPAEESEADDLPTDARLKVHRTYKKTRQRVRWFCESCDTLFTDGSKICIGCGHQRCDSCTRKPYVSYPPNRFFNYSNVVSISRPKKNKSDKSIDPELLKRVEEKLAHFVIHEQEASSAAPTVP